MVGRTLDLIPAFTTFRQVFPDGPKNPGFMSLRHGERLAEISAVPSMGPSVSGRRAVATGLEAELRAESRDTDADVLALSSLLIPRPR